MIYIRHQEAELLSYLTGRAPVGEWAHVTRAEILADLVLREDRLSQLLRSLVDRGLIERDWSSFYRVLHRLEDGGVEIVGKELPARRRNAQPAAPMAKPALKVRYPGYDSREVICWGNAHS